ncbi:MAG: hypothetical protein ACRC20_14770 [Segniliparus sp.]|uniref:hypothetical protein n=1 Tax=Segniliparus sp. TaxID=2804064 RepID=UPI003F353E9C
MAERVVRLSVRGREMAVDLHEEGSAAQALGMLCDKDMAGKRNENAQWPERGEWRSPWHGACGGPGPLGVFGDGFECPAYYGTGYGI